MDTEFFINVMGSSPAKGKRSKRLRPWFSGEVEEGPWSYSDSTQEYEHESEDDEMAAHSLMMLSHDLSSAPSHFPSPSKKVKKAREFPSADSPYEGEKRSSYECKTCSKKFLSFQALGGHRSSCCHSTNSAEDTTAKSEQANEKNSGGNKMKFHICPICCRVFSSGQALGGHKRTHSPATPLTHSAATENGYEQRAELDLNMPASLDDFCTQTEDSSAVPSFAAVRPHCKDFKMSPPFGWMTSSGKRVPFVYNANITDLTENEVLIGRDLVFKQDLFRVAPVN